MEHRSLRIGRWDVDFLFAIEEYDIKEVASYLHDADATYDMIKKARDVMERFNLNTGFTFTNKANCRAVVVIGPTSSGEEFIDTLVHEVHHLAVAIASNLGIDLEGETPAYIAGDSIRELADLICTMGCRSR